MTPHQLRGYIFEEVVAFMLGSAGYQLLVKPEQDKHDLALQQGDLVVRGRGAVHQVDVLGEFKMTPAFSQPLRLFVEAKSYGSAVRLPVVRNAMGTVSDVNQAWISGGSETRTRRRYMYALFSTSGFTAPAQDYAIAHQITLVDLSGDEWKFLRDMVGRLAIDLVAMGQSGSLRELRTELRIALGTRPGSGQGEFGWLLEPPVDLIQTWAAGLGDVFGGSLLCFPAGNQALLARPDNLANFLQYASEEPEHQVSLVPERGAGSGESRSWSVLPRDRGAYRLTVTLPERVQEVAMREARRRDQSLAAKSELGGHFDIYWDPVDKSLRSPVRGPRMFRLRFAMGEGWRAAS